MRKLAMAALALALIQAGELQAEECVVDELMQQNRKTLDKISSGIYDASVADPMEDRIDNAPSTKDASCLPMLDALDSMLRVRIPSPGALGGALMTKITDMACSAANGFLTDLASGAEFNISDPLGVASISGGLSTTGNGGVVTESYDITKVIEDAASQQIKSQVGNAAGQASREAMDGIGSGGVDRQPRIENTVKDGIRDALNGL